MSEGFDEDMTNRLQICGIFLNTRSPEEIERRLEQSDWDYVGENSDEEVGYMYLLEQDDDKYVVDKHDNPEKETPTVEIEPYEEWID